MVINVDSVEICGSFRKRYELELINEFLLRPLFWIEGIGGDHGLIPKYEIFESGAYPVCYSQAECAPCELATDTKSEDFVQPKAKIYPNPSNGNFNIVFEAYTGEKTVRVYNHQGMLVYTQQKISAQHTQITPELPPGLYWVKVSNGKSEQVSRLVIK